MRAGGQLLPHVAALFQSMPFSLSMPHSRRVERSISISRLPSGIARRCANGPSPRTVFLRGRVFQSCGCRGPHGADLKYRCPIQTRHKRERFLRQTTAPLTAGGISKSRSYKSFARSPPSQSSSRKPSPAWIKKSCRNFPCGVSRQA